MFNIEEQLKMLPDKPGVYIMHDVDDRIIYVGKAVNLKNRVRSYFRKTDKTERPGHIVPVLFCILPFHVIRFFRKTAQFSLILSFYRRYKGKSSIFFASRTKSKPVLHDNLVAN